MCGTSQSKCGPIPEGGYPVATTVMRVWVRKGDWDESKHPRAKDGEFGDGGAGGGGKPKGAGRIKEIKPRHEPEAKQVVEKGPHSPAEKKALQWYTSDGYKTINKSLRGAKGKPKDEKEARGLKAAPEHVKNIDSAMQKSELRHDTTLFRGYPGGAIGKVEPGSIVHDAGYSSTSLESRAATEFTRGTGSNKGPATIFVIHAPAGMPALYPNHHDRDPFKQREREVILPRGTQFKVEKVEMKNGVRHITVTAKHEKG